jgi:hypothetical protein
MRSEVIRQWKSWEKATGPKSPQGNAKASRNAYKGGQRAFLRDLARLLRELV